MNLLMLSLDPSAAEGRRGAFYYMLEEFHRYWDRVDVVTPPVGEFRCEKAFDNVFFHPVRGSRLLRVRRIVRKAEGLFAQRRYDFMTAQESGLFQNGRAAWRLRHAGGPAYFSEFHGIAGWPRAANLRAMIERGLTRRYLRRYAGRHPFFRVVNAFEMPEFLKSAGVPGEKIRVVPSGFVDLETFRPTGEGKVYDVSCVGRLVAGKGYELVIGAAAILAAKRPSLRVAIVGEGPRRRRLQSLARKLGVAGNVTFLGRSSRSAEIARTLNQSMVFAMTSASEGGPRTTLEAMACATPVVTTRVGIMHEVIEDGVNGFFVDWDPAEIAGRIERLLEDEPLRKSMGEAGLASVQRFRRQDVIRDYALACQRLAQEGR